MFSFVHCADLHLDSRLRNLHSRDDAPVEEIRSASRRALENLVTLCIDESVDFLLIAGDIYDGDWQDYSTGLFFNAMMRRLGEQGISVYLIKGNHDAESQISKRLLLPDNVYEFSSTGPETKTIDHLHVAIHGQSYKTRDIWENLALRYPDPLPGYFNIGLLHSALEGQEGHARYAPCSLDDLIQKGYDYWALGHIHQRQILHEYPFVIYPGNLQGRHIREEGEKGCTLVTVDEGNVSIEHRPLDVFRFVKIPVDLSGAESVETFHDRVAEAIGQKAAENDGIPLAARIILHGRTRLHREMAADWEQYFSEIENAARMNGEQIWIEKVKVETEEVEGREPPVSSAHFRGLWETLHEAMEDADFLKDYLSHLQSIQLRLGAYMKREDATRFETVEDLHPLFEDARKLLAGMLEKGGRKE